VVRGDPRRLGGGALIGVPIQGKEGGEKKDFKPPLPHPGGFLGLQGVLKRLKKEAEGRKGMFIGGGGGEPVPVGGS